jgi:hypothetical protein
MRLPDLIIFQNYPKEKIRPNGDIGQFGTFQLVYHILGFDHWLLRMSFSKFEASLRETIWL